MNRPSSQRKPKSALPAGKVAKLVESVEEPVVRESMTAKVSGEKGQIEATSQKHVDVRRLRKRRPSGSNEESHRVAVAAFKPNILQRINPYTWTTVFMVVMVGVEETFRLLPTSISSVRYLCPVLFCAGILMVLWTRSMRRKEGVSSRFFEVPNTLVTSGPYALSRHPEYLGLMMICASVFSYYATLLPFIIFILYTQFMARVFVNQEEKVLAARFKVGWLRYQEDTHRWL